MPDLYLTSDGYVWVGEDPPRFLAQVVQGPGGWTVDGCEGAYATARAAVVGLAMTMARGGTAWNTL